MSSKNARTMAVQGFRSQKYPPPSRVFIPPNTPSTTPRNRYTSGSHPSRARTRASILTSPPPLSRITGRRPSPLSASHTSFPSNPASAKSHPPVGANRRKALPPSWGSGA